MTAGIKLLSLVVIILGFGVVAQILSDRLEIPSVLFLILAGTVVGPEGLDLVGLESFGGSESLSAIVGFSIAIIFLVAHSLSSVRGRAITGRSAFVTSFSERSSAVTWSS